MSYAFHSSCSPPHVKGDEILLEGDRVLPEEGGEEPLRSFLYTPDGALPNQLHLMARSRKRNLDLAGGDNGGM
jgi:hypothetical protein